MYKIQLNPTGTHFLDITDDHLNTIRKYALFRDLIDSNGYVRTSGICCIWPQTSSTTTA